ncbi:hypothetical protein DN31_3712 [Vibrio mimicus]|nr:hypothetical protein DN31_3712 [Vibrio mimicus]
MQTLFSYIPPVNAPMIGNSVWRPSSANEVCESVGKSKALISVFDEVITSSSQRLMLA